MSETDRLLNEIAQRGWSVSFMFESDGTWYVEGAHAGDCNCPYFKEYDPVDGHGWSHADIPEDSLPKRNEDWTFDNMVRLIHAEIMKITPGQPYPGEEAE